MQFEPIPILSKIRALYDMPRSKERFDKYLYLLQGIEKEDMILPIASFNPMGNQVASAQLNKLIELGAESILNEVIDETNDNINIDNRVIQVAINLVDDVEGSWSEHYTTDYKSKFEFVNLLNRGFCTPIFWTSEVLSEINIRERIIEYLRRTMFWVENGQPQSLQDCLDQEVYVQSGLDNSSALNESELKFLKGFLKQYGQTQDAILIYNFFYGDEGSENLSYIKCCIKRNGGFEYSKYLAST